MSFFEDSKQWSCGKAGKLKLHCVGSIVCDIGDPCLNPSPTKMSKMLKPDKWQATFDGDGKNFCFHKALKLIILGGVDPSIRAEVWEFLLGCYTLSSTADDRKQLRNARRERYGNLIKQCQMMHSSIGTGSLAYVVGSKVMDMRTITMDQTRREVEVKSKHDLDDVSESPKRTELDNCADTPFERERSSDSDDLVSVRRSTDSAAYDSSSFLPNSSPCDFPSEINSGDADGSGFVSENYFDFPPLPVTELFANKSTDIKRNELHKNIPPLRKKLRFREQSMHSFQICNNEDLIIESNDSARNYILSPVNCEKEIRNADVHRPSESVRMEYKSEMVNGLRISDVPALNATSSHETRIGEERVSEWLWTLHQIVVDVVRTDNHLLFYEDTRNLARMSDILAVYAWVDPATGYCQGMSDLLSPFVVLFDDNADAFWCFERLLKRMRDNFQMEGPTGVMKQLQSLWRILELTDKEMFVHFSRIGAESLHFAFRMLLVLFRRELSFNEALSMWEMMWAADFDESVACNLEVNCLEPLAIQMPKDSSPKIGEVNAVNGSGSVKDGLQTNQLNEECSYSASSELKSQSNHPFCGLTRNFWSKNERFNISSTQISLTRNGDDDLPVYCVAAILIMNRHKMIKETSSIDDLIKIFNDGMLTIRVKRCVRSAIKLRNKYFYKLMKSKNTAE